MGVKKSLASKLLWTFLAFFVFYLIGWGFNFVPQPVQDLVSWTANNFALIVFLICFVLVIYTINHRRKGGSA